MRLSLACIHELLTNMASDTVAPIRKSFRKLRNYYNEVFLRIYPQNIDTHISDHVLTG